MLPRQGREGYCTCRQKASEWPVGVPHQAWIRRSTSLSPGGRTLGSPCCELLQHTHRCQRPCGSCHISEAVSDPHHNKAQHCRCSSLGTGMQDLSITRSRCQMQAPRLSSQALTKHTEAYPFLNGCTWRIASRVSTGRHLHRLPPGVSDTVKRWTQLQLPGSSTLIGARGQSLYIFRA